MSTPTKTPPPSGLNRRIRRCRSGEGGMTAAEQDVFRCCERIIQTGRQTFLAVGSALLKIRDGKLYRDDYGTFEEYCAKRWDIGRTTAYRLMEATEIMADLSQVGTKPESQAQALALAPLTPEKRVEAWNQAVEESEGKPTAAVVEKVVERIQERDDRKLAERKAQKAKEWADPVFPIGSLALGNNLHVWKLVKRETEKTYLFESVPPGHRWRAQEAIIRRDCKLLHPEVRGGGFKAGDAAEHYSNPHRSWLPVTIVGYHNGLLYSIGEDGGAASGHVESPAEYRRPKPPRAKPAPATEQPAEASANPTPVEVLPPDPPAVDEVKPSTVPGRIDLPFGPWRALQSLSAQYGLARHSIVIRLIDWAGSGASAEARRVLCRERSEIEDSSIVDAVRVGDRFVTARGCVYTVAEAEDPANIVLHGVGGPHLMSADELRRMERIITDPTWTREEINKRESAA